MILLADRHLDQLPQIITALNENNVAFFGAVFPGLIHGRHQLLEGAVVKQVPCIGPPVIVQLAEQNLEWLSPLTPSGEISQSKPTLYLFVDRSSSNIAGLMADLFNRFGNTVNYFGGGSGGHSIDSKGVLFTSEGQYSNAAVAAIAEGRGAVNVRHGWERINGPFVATRTENNIIHEINWEPAIDTYIQALPSELHSVAADDFYPRIASYYSLSIKKEGREDIVRDPIRTTDEGALVCLSDVPTNSLMYLVHGEPDQLVSAASQAVEELIEASFLPITGCLVCDCYSRALMLDGQFTQELSVVADGVKAAAPGVEVEGVIAWGEIASDGEQSLEFYNKTFAINVSYE